MGRKKDQRWKHWSVYSENMKLCVMILSFSVHVWSEIRAPECTRLHRFASGFHMVNMDIIDTGVGHTDSESAQHFWLGKTHKVFLCSWWGSNLGHRWPRILSLMLYQLNHRTTLSISLVWGMQQHPPPQNHAKCWRGVWVREVRNCWISGSNVLFRHATVPLSKQFSAGFFPSRNQLKKPTITWKKW